MQRHTFGQAHAAGIAPEVGTAKPHFWIFRSSRKRAASTASSFVMPEAGPPITRASATIASTSSSLQSLSVP